MTSKINIFKPLLLTISLLFNIASNANETNETKSEKFNAGELIIGHITDAHDWHVAGDEEHPISVPLPIILYSKERGLSVFMSNKFEHGHKTYNGYMLKKMKLLL